MSNLDATDIRDLVLIALAMSILYLAADVLRFVAVM